MVTALAGVEAVRAPYPQGAASGRRSIEEVARLAKEGADSPVTIAWVAHCLREAGGPQTVLGRAKALLEGIRKKLVYFPDPNGQERMVGAHITLADLIPGGDCDDLTIAFLSCCRAAAIPCCSVGHGYDWSGTIQHVLGAIYEAGHWYYADPSPFMGGYPEFGAWPVAPTWEYVLDVATGQVLCDAKNCLVPGSGVRPGAITDPGHFLGVAGPPPMTSSSPTEALLQTTDAPWSAYLAAQKQDLVESWRRASSAYASFRKVVADQELPFPDPPITETPTGARRIGWTSDDEQTLAQVAAMVDVIGRALDEAASGKRHIFPVNAKGLADPAGTDVGIELLPTDTVKVLTSAAFAAQGLGSVPSPVLVDAITGAPVGVGNPWLIAAGLAVVAVATIAGAMNVKAICGTVETVANDARTAIITVAMAGLVASGAATPDESTKMAKTIADGTNAQIAATAKLEKERNKPNPAWITALYVLGGVAVLWGGYEVLKRVDFGKKKSPSAGASSPPRAVRDRRSPILSSGRRRRLAA